MFQLKNVTYKGILHIPQLTIEEGKVTTLFGESGSGKSTLMKLLNHLISCDDGSITYKGRLLTDYDPIELRREVIMLSQTPAMFEGTVRENLLIGLRFSGKQEVEDSLLKEILTKVSLKKKLNEDAQGLSGGEKQRLAFARVMIMNPPVYLIDEPTSSLDEQTEDLVMQHFIEHVKENNKTVVMVTHSRAVADKYSDTIVYMSDLNRVQREIAYD